jgi:hypothetical protein
MHCAINHKEQGSPPGQFLDVAKLHQGRDQSVEERAEDEDEEELEPTHIVPPHALANEHAVVVQILNAALAHRAVLALGSGRNAALVTESTILLKYIKR